MKGQMYTWQTKKKVILEHKRQNESLENNNPSELLIHIFFEKITDLSKQI